MSIRNFRLVNKDGKEYRLLTQRVFLHSPSGLGYKENTTYQQLGNQFAVIDPGFDQANPTGYVFFPQPNAYEKYHDFVQFCQDTPLRLFYKPRQTEYIMDVRLDEIKKTEIDETTGLNCSVSFLGLSMWYKEQSVYNDGSAGEEGKIYEYEYEYIYNSNEKNTLHFNSDSYYDSPVRLTIYGPCVNPHWAHYANGVLQAEGGITYSIPDGYKVVVDAMNIPYSIKLVDSVGDETADLYQDSDFGTERFLKAQRGANAIIITHTTTDALRMLAEARISYASV